MTAEDLAHDFLRMWCEEHEYFHSGEVLDAYKALGHPPPEGDKGWRDKWGSVVTRAQRANFMKKVGKAFPISVATHMSSTALWMSLLYKGERTSIETGADRIEVLRRMWVERQISDLRQLLWQAYDFGYDQGVSGKAKLPAKPPP